MRGGGLYKVFCWMGEWSRLDAFTSRPPLSPVWFGCILLSSGTCSVGCSERTYADSTVTTIISEQELCLFLFFFVFFCLLSGT